MALADTRPRALGRSAQAPPWEEFLSKEDKAAREILSIGEENPKLLGHILKKGWGGVTSRCGRVTEAVLPVLQAMSIKESEMRHKEQQQHQHAFVGEENTNPTEFVRANQEVREGLRNKRRVEAVRRLSAARLKELDAKEMEISDVLSACSEMLENVREEKAQHTTVMMRARKESEHLGAKCQAATTALTIQATKLIRKHAKIDVVCADKAASPPRYITTGPTVEDTLPDKHHQEEEEEDATMQDSVSSLLDRMVGAIPQDPHELARLRRSYAQRKGGDSGRPPWMPGPGESVYDYQYEEGDSSIEDPAIRADIERRRLRWSQGGKEPAGNYGEIKSYKVWRRMARLVWLYEESKQAAFPSEVRSDLLDPDMANPFDPYDAETSWWSRFVQFWYAQRGMPFGRRMHDHAAKLMAEWDGFHVQEVAQLVPPPSSSSSVPCASLASDEDALVEICSEISRVDARLTDIVEASSDGDRPAVLDPDSAAYVRDFMAECARQRGPPSKAFLDHHGTGIPSMVGDAMDELRQAMDAPTILTAPLSAEKSREAQRRSVMMALDTGPIPFEGDPNAEPRDLSCRSEWELEVIHSIAPKAWKFLVGASSHPSVLTMRTEEQNAMDELMVEGSVSGSNTAKDEKARRILTADDVNVIFALVRQLAFEAVRVSGKTCASARGGVGLDPRKAWAISRSYELLRFLACSNNGAFQRKKAAMRGTKPTLALTSPDGDDSVEAVSERMQRHHIVHRLTRSAIFNSCDAGMELIRAIGDGCIDVMFGNHIHADSWVVDWPIRSLVESKLPPVPPLGGDPASIARFHTRTVDIELPWDYTMAGWICIRCMAKLSERHGNCPCLCFRGHTRKQCRSPGSPCYGFHPNRFMEYVALGIPRGREMTKRRRGSRTTTTTTATSSASSEGRAWGDRQKRCRPRKCIKRIIAHGDPWFGVVPPEQRGVDYTGITHSAMPLLEDWFQNMSWVRYNPWDEERRRWRLMVMVVGRLDMQLVGNGILTPHGQPSPPFGSRSHFTRDPRGRRRAASDYRSSAKSSWADISQVCAGCGQDLANNKNNTSRGLCAGCRAWKPIVSMEQLLIPNDPVYAPFRNKRSRTIMEQCAAKIEEFFVSGLYTEEPADPNFYDLLTWIERDVEWNRKMHAKTDESIGDAEIRRRCVHMARTRVSSWSEASFRALCAREGGFSDPRSSPPGAVMPTWSRESIALAESWRAPWRAVVRRFIDDTKGIYEHVLASKPADLEQEMRMWPAPAIEMAKTWIRWRDYDQLKNAVRKHLAVPVNEKGPLRSTPGVSNFVSSVTPTFNADAGCLNRMLRRHPSPRPPLLLLPSSTKGSKPTKGDALPDNPSKRPKLAAGCLDNDDDAVLTFLRDATASAWGIQQQHQQEDGTNEANQQALSEMAVSMWFDSAMQEAASEDTDSAVDKTLSEMTASMWMS